MRCMAARGGDDVARFASTFGGIVFRSGGGGDGGRERRGDGFVGIW